MDSGSLSNRRHVVSGGARGKLGAAGRSEVDSMVDSVNGSSLPPVRQVVSGQMGGRLGEWS